MTSVMVLFHRQWGRKKECCMVQVFKIFNQILVTVIEQLTKKVPTFGYAT